METIVREEVEKEVGVDITFGDLERVKRSEADTNSDGAFDPVHGEPLVKPMMQPLLPAPQTEWLAASRRLCQAKLDRIGNAEFCVFYGLGLQVDLVK
ncbi:hypothetical protein E2C01_005237 [Portunus trituberculatus]|uniref:Uncharacterized protein n=1 Tax=Portunus trituberculatus TaxID=210409 RepID=A0A5B7CTR0_PORTR|nr:hypothetical protein [Portunus trituberculatus]